ncbi:MAG: beta-ketoacyl-ACP synthase, partial [Candidatus Competibacteraceae bacterium]|nr:beta-ketoacyl-ACP synthase [Candidatus Competibacteraceae bacterium]
MRKAIGFAIVALSFLALAALAQDNAEKSASAGDSSNAEKSLSVGDLSMVKSIVIDRGLTPEGKQCVTCHINVNPGIISDWKNSRHGHVGVSCIDCHRVNKDSPMATQHEDLVGTDVYISTLVPPSTCGRCHSEELKQFEESGHFRAYRQIIPKDSLHALVHKHEGRSNPELSNAPNETGCMQCHGTKIELDADGRPTPETWPNMGMGNIYPDGSTAIAARVIRATEFQIAESRKPTP